MTSEEYLAEIKKFLTAIGYDYTDVVNFVGSIHGLTVQTREARDKYVTTTHRLQDRFTSNSVITADDVNLYLRGTESPGDDQ